MVTGFQKGFLHGFSLLLGQQPSVGALPTLMAAIPPNVERNDYFGPSGFIELRGFPVKAESSQSAKDSHLAERHWNVSEEMTGVKFGWPVQA